MNLAILASRLEDNNSLQGVLPRSAFSCRPAYRRQSPRAGPTGSWRVALFAISDIWHPLAGRSPPPHTPVFANNTLATQTDI